LEAGLPALFLGITEPKQSGKPNALRTLLEAHGIPLLAHPTGIGGRYSALTNVGLLPALARGLDPRKLRAGARRVVEALLAAATPPEFPAPVGAAVAGGVGPRPRGGIPGEAAPPHPAPPPSPP